MDYRKVSESADFMWRLASINNKRLLGGAIKSYLQEGIKEPGIARYIKAESRAKVINQLSEEYMQVTYPRFSGLIKATIGPLLASFRISKKIKFDPELRKLNKLFKDKFNTMYPQSKSKRKVIEFKIFGNSLDNTLPDKY